MTTPYYSDDHVVLFHGDCREVTAWLEADEIAARRLTQGVLSFEAM